MEHWIELLNFEWTPKTIDRYIKREWILIERTGSL